jgi:nucleoside-diphosphate-sugar epimerase
MTPSILITGATGFLGKTLAIYFLNQGHKVHLIVRRPQVLESLTEHYSNIFIHHYDNSYTSLASLNDVSAFAVCFHIAALTVYEVTPDNLDAMIDANLRFGIHLLEKLREIKCDKFINTGTYWQHYRGSDYDPVCLYAATKQAFNAIIEYYARAYGLKAITLKLFEVYGPHDPRKKIFTVLLNALQSNEKLLMSPGEQLLNMTFIDDVVSAYEQSMSVLINSQGGMNREYFVQSDQSYCLKEIVNLFFQIAGKNIDIEWGGRPYYTRQVMQPYAGELVPGWQAKVNLQEGIQRVLQAARIA